MNELALWIGAPLTAAIIAIALGWRVAQRRHRLSPQEIAQQRLADHVAFNRNRLSMGQKRGPDGRFVRG